MNLVLLPQQTNPESPLACGNRRWQNARGKSSQARGSSVQILRGMLLCLSVVFVAGCGSSGPELYPVCGKVSFEGQAISTGIVMFYPENGDRPAIGEIAADGTYQLRTYNDQPGAVLGKHKVTITARTEAAPGQEAGSEDRVAPVKGELVARAAQVTVRWIVPEVYSERESTPLSADVAAQENTIDFALPIPSGQ